MRVSNCVEMSRLDEAAGARDREEILQVIPFDRSSELKNRSSIFAVYRSNLGR
jgi:hypothetical protein